MIKNEVVIIGAGAAGSTAAFHLAKKGINVTCLEKQSSNQFKCCGGGISSSVQNLFDFDLEPIIEEVIREVHFTWNLDDEVKAKLPGSAPFWILRRENLDNLILSNAINAGANFRSSFKVKNIEWRNLRWEVTAENGDKLTAKCIIIADGSLSKWPDIFGLGPRNKNQAKTISIRANKRGNISNGTAKFEFGLVKNGFAWVFPIRNGLNIGIGTFTGRNNNNNVEIIEKILLSLGINKNEVKIRERLLNIWNGHHRLDGKGILVIGDAASLCDPFLAEGLRPAIISGYEAANCISKWLNNESKDLQEYTQIIKRKWGNSMAWGKRIAQVFYRFPRIGYQLGIKKANSTKKNLSNTIRRNGI